MKIKRQTQLSLNGMTLRVVILFFLSSLISGCTQRDEYGELIFEDNFERTESQELKDEPGNNWTTSSDKTANGHKQVDLIDGTMHMWMHESANHSTSTRHAFEFTDGTIEMRFLLENDMDILQLNFADLTLKSVWAGHLFDVVIALDYVKFEDKKTGSMNLEIRKARKEKRLTNEQRAFLKTKKKRIAYTTKKGEWHHLLVHVKGDMLLVEIDRKEVGNFHSEGITHETKKLLRLLVPSHAYIDDMKIWRKK